MSSKQVAMAVGVGAAALAVGTTAYLVADAYSERIETVPRFQSISILPEKDGESITLRNILGNGELLETTDDDVKTLYDAFLKGKSLGGHRPCYGYRQPHGGPYQWKSYDEVEEMAMHIGSGLQYLDIPAGSKIGIFAMNRLEWGYVLQSCSMYSNTLVSLYSTLGEASARHILNKCEIPVLFVTKDSYPKIKADLAHLPHLKYMIHFDMEEGDEISFDNVTCMSFDRFISLGKASPKPVHPPKPTTIYSIQFTSGTTGVPKGVVSTHGQCVAEFTAAVLGLKGYIGPNDVHISYLPLAHSFERVVQYVIMSRGGSIGFFRGDIKKHLFEDIKELRPTIFCSVPRLFNRLYDAAMKKLSELEGIKKSMFERGWATKKSNLQHGQLRHWLWDRLVFSKIAGFLGGNVKIMLSGSAPISPEVLEFLRICFSCQVLEGYGQTENVGGCSFTLPGDMEPGHVGPPMVCNEVKLVDVPHMNYLSTDMPYPRGELCIRGYNVMSGYYDEEEKTKEAIDEDGWLHTGDIACFLPSGCIKVVDRVKSIFKLSQGEYIAPEKVENYYVKSEYISQAYVHGDSTQDCIVAVIVVDAQTVKPWAEAKGLSSDMKSILRTAELQQLILSEIEMMAAKYKLNGLETARLIHLDDEEFTIENGLLTPSFKLVRRVALEKYQGVIAALYRERSD